MQGITRKSPIEARRSFIKCRRSFSQTSRRPAGLEPNAPEVKAAQAYCSDLVRKYDSPSYTLAHFIKPHMLPAYFAIRAFNIEISRIPDVVSNPTIGAMRMQFWRDTINATFDHRPPEEPVATLLGSYLAQGYKLNKTWFQKIVSSRDKKQTHPGFTNISELESYAESTYSTLLYLTLSALPINSVTLDHLASHVGKAAGISTVLRGVPLLAFPAPPNQHSNNPPGLGLPSRRNRQGVINLPLDIMAECGVREHDIFQNGANASGLKDAVFAVATRASDHLITARTMLKSIKDQEDVGHEYEHIHDDGHDYNASQTDSPQSTGQPVNELSKSFSIIMGPAVSTQLWLDRLQKVDFDIFNTSLRTMEWKLPAVAWWKNRNQTF